MPLTAHRWNRSPEVRVRRLKDNLGDEGLRTPRRNPTSAQLDEPWFGWNDVVMAHRFAGTAQVAVLPARAPPKFPRGGDGFWAATDDSRTVEMHAIWRQNWQGGAS